MSSAAVPRIVVDGGAGLHVGQRKPVSAEQEAKLRERHQKIVASRESREAWAFPEPEVCLKVVRRGIELYLQGFRQGEIDDQVGREFGLEGWQVQYIDKHYQINVMRALDAMIAGSKNMIDMARDHKRDLFEDAPGQRV